MKIYLLLMLVGVIVGFSYFSSPSPSAEGRSGNARAVPAES